MWFSSRKSTAFVSALQRCLTDTALDEECLVPENESVDNRVSAVKIAANLHTSES
jgi:hypothetical protein